MHTVLSSCRFLFPKVLRVFLRAEIWRWVNSRITNQLSNKGWNDRALDAHGTLHHNAMPDSEIIWSNGSRLHCLKMLSCKHQGAQEWQEALGFKSKKLVKAVSYGTKWRRRRWMRGKRGTVRNDGRREKQCMYKVRAYTPLWQEEVILEERKPYIRCVISRADHQSRPHFFLNNLGTRRPTSIK